MDIPYMETHIIDPELIFKNVIDDALQIIDKYRQKVRIYKCYLKRGIFQSV